MRVALLTEEDLAEICERAALMAVEKFSADFNCSPEIMTLAQVAAYCSVSEPTIRKAIRGKGFPFTDRLGGKRFLRVEVDNWMKRNK